MADRAFNEFGRPSQRERPLTAGLCRPRSPILPVAFTTFIKYVRHYLRGIAPPSPRLPPPYLP